jgi:hypothetical protein
MPQWRFPAPAFLAALCMTCVPAAHAADRPSLAVPHATGPIRVDGQLDEEAWSAAGVARHFELMIPREGQVPSESTEVRVLRDGGRVVFGFRCFARRKPHSGLAARDQVLDNDHISVHLDTDGDGQRGYIFGVNPYGVQVDGILTLDADFKWDGVWDAAARRGDGEWTAEIAVPFRILRISANGKPWRLWVRRELRAWNEVSSWPLYRAGEPGPIMLQGGDLTGLDGAQGGREFTLEPYVFGASLGERSPLASGGVSDWSDEGTSEAGLDVQAALTPSLVANATFNPDFSQIEADALQIDVNRRFPIIYPEKRPFFLEGADHFVTLMDLVLTRRMAEPEWGAKVTGRSGRWNTAGLVVRDAGGSLLAGSGYSPSTDNRLTRPGWYSLVRTQLPFGQGSNIGMVGGLHAQDGEDGPATIRERATSNVWGGFDTQLRLDARWRTEAQIVASTSRIDSTGTGRATEPFTDWMGVARLFYRDKARELHVGVRHVGEKFRDELGYQDYAGVTYRRVGGWWDLFHKQGMLNRWAPIFDVLVVHDRTGRLEYDQIEAAADFEFRRGAYLNVGYRHHDEHWRGHTYPQDRAHVYAEWRAWRPLSLDVDVLAGDAILFGPTSASSALVWSDVVTLNATFRPEPRVTAAANVLRFRLAESFERGELADVWAVGVKTTAQFTRRLSARLYPQYDSDRKHVDVNALLGYVVQPGTVFYAGVNSGWDQDVLSGKRTATSRQFFAKASWRLSP